MPVFRRNAASAAAGDLPSPSVQEQPPWCSLTCIIDFLQAVKWPDGTTRSTGTILIFFEQGSFKLCLNDRDAAQSAFISARTLTEAFLKAEEAVGTGTGDWRSKGPKGRKGG
jgi:hypothetical protein